MDKVQLSHLSYRVDALHRRVRNAVLPKVYASILSAAHTKAISEGTRLNLNHKAIQTAEYNHRNGCTWSCALLLAMVPNLTSSDLLDDEAIQALANWVSLPVPEGVFLPTSSDCRADALQLKYFSPSRILRDFPLTRVLWTDKERDAFNYSPPSPLVIRAKPVHLLSLCTTAATLNIVGY